jgi:two-component system response regulator
MTGTTILLVEDNRSDEELTLRAFKKGKITNRIDVVRDGAEAVDYLFARGAYETRDVNDLPQVVVLDLNLPKIGGLEVLRQIRADSRTKLLPVVILTSSKQDRDLFASYEGGANSFVVKPVDFTQFSDAIQQLGLYWLLLNQPLPRTT